MLKIVCIALLVVGTFGKPRYEVSKHDLTAHDINFRINGGVAASPGEFPFTAILKSPNGYIDCGATLISDYYVITAAHCLRQRIVENVVVRLGEYDMTTDEDGFHVDIPAERFVTYPEFNYLTFLHDIALVRLSKPAPRTTSITPICLPPSRDYVGEKATISGWGSNSPASFPVPRLQKLDVKILNEQDCKDLLAAFSRFYTPEKICGFEKGKDGCKGDSGGPLSWKDSNDLLTKKRYLIGIMSFGINCGMTGKPGLFTRVTSYIDWIKENTKDDTTICWGD